MNDNKYTRRRAGRIVLSVLTLLMLWIILGASSMAGEDSSALSRWVTELAQGIVELMGLPLTIPELLVRKCAHFTEYLVLGALLHGLVRSFAPGLRLRATWLAAALCGLVTAALDETLQRFVPGRDGNGVDVMIDMAGILCGAAIVGAAIYCRTRVNTVLQ